jgi:hypothetical protein
VHTCPLAQARPQRPQLDGSEARFTQRVPHRSGVAAGHAQVLASHSWLLPGQRVPQLPQFPGSDCTLVQVLAQTSGVDGAQPHCPASHCAPPTVQEVAQPPQWVASEAKSTHSGEAPAQATAGAVHVQRPAWHVPRPQAWPQPPQLRGSEFTAVHRPRQTSSPPGQPQIPPSQEAPEGHGASQEPQAVTSPLRSAHRSPQLVWPVGHWGGQPENQKKATHPKATAMSNAGRAARPMSWFKYGSE